MGDDLVDLPPMRHARLAVAVPRCTCSSEGARALRHPAFRRRWRRARALRTGDGSIGDPGAMVAPYLESRRVNSRSAGLLPLVLLVLLAGISYWLEGISRFAPERAHAGVRGVPDFVMDRFRSVPRRAVMAVPLYTITAEQLRHYAPTEQSELSRAELRDLTPERPP